MEKEWGITQGVRKEWGGTFDKLLSYHNKRDLGTITRAICCKKPPDENDAKRLSKIRESNLLDVEELKNWMTPRLEPYAWKKYLWKKRYDSEKKHYDKVYYTLFGETITDGRGVSRRCFKSKIKSCENGISKDDFLIGVTKELRKGNREVGRVDCFKYPCY